MYPQKKKGDLNLKEYFNIQIPETWKDWPADWQQGRLRLSFVLERLLSSMKKVPQKKAKNKALTRGKWILLKPRLGNQIYDLY